MNEMNEKSKTVSVVIPFLNEKDNLPRLYERLGRVFQEQPEKMEIIFVDDGSTDGSPEWVEQKALEDQRVRLLRFSRNFGHQIAITAGFDHAAGDAVIVMDADLQDPPEVIPDLLAKWRAGFEVVYAVRKSREGEGFVKKFLAHSFYKIFRMMVKFNVPLNAGDFRLLDRAVVEALKQMREAHRYMRAMTSWVGFSQCAVEYDRQARFAGETKYPAWKSLRLAIDGMTSFSAAPLRWVSGLGICVSILGVLWLAIILWGKFQNPSGPVPGWTSVIAAVLIFSGVQMISIGLLGQYISRIFEESKKRPLYILRKK